MCLLYSLIRVTAACMRSCGVRCAVVCAVCYVRAGVGQVAIGALDRGMSYEGRVAAGCVARRDEREDQLRLADGWACSTMV